MQQRRRRSRWYNKLKGTPWYIYVIIISCICIIGFFGFDTYKTMKKNETANVQNDLLTAYKSLKSQTENMFVTGKKPFIYSEPNISGKTPEDQLKTIEVDFERTEVEYEKFLKRQEAEMGEVDEKTRNSFLSKSILEIQNDRKKVINNLELLKWVTGCYTSLNEIFQENGTDKKKLGVLHNAVIDKSPILKDNVSLDEFDMINKKYYTKHPDKTAYKEFYTDINHLLDTAKEQLRSIINVQHWLEEHFPNETPLGKPTEESLKQLTELVGKIKQQKLKKEYQKQIELYKKAVAEQQKLDKEEEDKRREEEEALQKEEEENRRKAEAARTELERIEAEKERARIEKERLEREAEYRKQQQWGTNNNSQGNNQTGGNGNGTQVPPGGNGNNGSTGNGGSTGANQGNSNGGSTNNENSTGGNGEDGVVN